ncbi:hypothetical protein CSW62_24405 [Caulobacter sp. FWC2]|nr:hypothetical protein CSW62_24405 [Caulobacter sp. FWC2]
MIWAWIRSIPVVCWVAMAGFIVYSTFFAPPAFSESNWFFIAGTALFWATYFGGRWLAKVRYSQRD